MSKIIIYHYKEPLPSTPNSWSICYYYTPDNVTLLWSKSPSLALSGRKFWNDCAIGLNISSLVSRFSHGLIDLTYLDSIPTWFFTGGQPSTTHHQTRLISVRDSGLGLVSVRVSGLHLYSDKNCKCRTSGIEWPELQKGTIICRSEPYLQNVRLLWLR